MWGYCCCLSLCGCLFQVACLIRFGVWVVYCVVSYARVSGFSCGLGDFLLGLLIVVLLACW